MPKSTYTDIVLPIADYKRDFAFSNPRIMGTEVLITPTMSALLMTRVR